MSSEQRQEREVPYAQSLPPLKLIDILSGLKERGAVSITNEIRARLHTRICIQSILDDTQGLLNPFADWFARRCEVVDFG